MGAVVRLRKIINMISHSTLVEIKDCGHFSIAVRPGLIHEPYRPLARATDLFKEARSSFLEELRLYPPPARVFLLLVV